jgi:hypothetical protein
VPPAKVYTLIFVPIRNSNESRSFFLPVPSSVPTVAQIWSSFGSGRPHRHQGNSDIRCSMAADSSLAGAGKGICFSVAEARRNQMASLTAVTSRQRARTAKTPPLRKKALMLTGQCAPAGPSESVRNSAN